MIQRKGRHHNESIAMLSFLRGRGPIKRETSKENPVYFENGTASMEFHRRGEEWSMTHVIPNNKSMFNPPLHVHLNQDEYFVVKEGAGVWYLPTTSNPALRKQVVKAGGQPISIPAAKFHRFENVSTTERLVINIRFDPETSPRGADEAFFRNFFGYLEDCRLSNIGPSIFQLGLFGHTVDGPLAIPVPGPDFVKAWVSRVFSFLLGIVIGEWILGYRRSYPEYSREEDASLK